MEDKSFFSRKFILTVATAIASFWGAAQGFLPQELAVKIAGAVAAVYVIVNGLIKVAQIIAPMTKTTKDDEAILDLIEAVELLKGKISPATATTVNVDTGPK